LILIAKHETGSEAASAEHRQRRRREATARRAGSRKSAQPDRPRHRKGRAAATRQVAGLAASRLREKAEGCARDARKFRDAARLGQPILSEAEDANWASVYQAIADAIRQVADEVREELS
jgi:hypothetical protein